MLQCQTSRNRAINPYVDTFKKTRFTNSIILSIISALFPLPLFFFFFFWTLENKLQIVCSLSLHTSFCVDFQEPGTCSPIASVHRSKWILMLDRYWIDRHFFSFPQLSQLKSFITKEYPGTILFFFFFKPALIWRYGGSQVRVKSEQQ